MSEVQMVIRDATQDLSAVRHGGFAERAVAALSADPVTIDELEVAMQRFMKPSSSPFFAGFSRGLDDRPADAGLVVIDLAARLVVVDGNYFSPASTGSVWYHDGEQCSNIPVWYDLAQEWLLMEESSHWRSVARSRRRERAKHLLCDDRAVLSGQALLEFIASECFLVFPCRERIANSAGARHSPRLVPNDERGASPYYDTLKDIHARWLLTPREELNGRVPRAVLLADHDRRMRDMQFRSDQWSMMDECPRGLDATSHAYRFGGFGTHELVMYYEQVRELLWSCWDRLMELDQSPHAARRPAALTLGEFLVAEVPRLDQHLQQWLDTPRHEFGLRTPREITHRERARIPEAVSGEDAMVDPDCPCCQMLADLPGPMFWSLDGSGMDDEFAFDIYYSDRDEWDQNQNELAAAGYDLDIPEGVQESAHDRWLADTSGRAAADSHAESGIWKRSFIQEYGPDAPTAVRMFALVCHLAELLEDLREWGDETNLGGQLNREFGNLREVLGVTGSAATPSLVEPVVSRMCDLLDSIAAEYRELDRKCDDLSNQLTQFLAP